MRAVVMAPIGFVSDHIEVLYDLDREAASVCRELGVPFARAASANDNPVFLDMLADVVRAEWARYTGGRPLAIAHPRGADEPPNPYTGGHAPASRV
jgi:ferrochelatase